MTIEPVLEIFGRDNGAVINRLRQVIFEEFAKTDLCGMIFTYMWAYGQPADWHSVEQVKRIFEPYGTEFHLCAAAGLCEGRVPLVTLFVSAKQKEKG